LAINSYGRQEEEQNCSKPTIVQIPRMALFRTVKIMRHVAGGWWILPDEEVVRIYKKKYVMKHKIE